MFINPDTLTQANAYDFDIMSREDFLNETGTLLNGQGRWQTQAIQKRVQLLEGSFVLLDPIDNHQGFLLVGYNPQELVDELYDRFELDAVGVTQ